MGRYAEQSSEGGRNEGSANSSMERALMTKMLWCAKTTCRHLLYYLEIIGHTESFDRQGVNAGIHLEMVIDGLLGTAEDSRSTSHPIQDYSLGRIIAKS